MSCHRAQALTQHRPTCKVHSNRMMKEKKLSHHFLHYYWPKSRLFQRVNMNNPTEIHRNPFWNILVALFNCHPSVLFWPWCHGYLFLTVSIMKAAQGVFSLLLWLQIYLVALAQSWLKVKATTHHGPVWQVWLWTGIKTVQIFYTNQS